MGAVDFTEWAVPDLILTFRGVTYTVAPPSVADMKLILAAAARAEVNLRLVAGPLPPEVEELLATVGDRHPALGDDVFDQMVADGVPGPAIDRMAYYAAFFWARGREYADRLAVFLWTPRDPDGGGDAVPKARPRSPRKSGRSTGKASRSTKTRTASPSTPTTESPTK